MAQQTIETTTYLILIILVIAIGLVIWARPAIFDWFKNLPGYEGEEGSVEYTLDELAQLGKCIGEDYVANVKIADSHGSVRRHWIYIKEGNTEEITLFYLSNDLKKVYMSRKGRNTLVGSLDSLNKINIDKVWLISNELNFEEREQLGEIHNTYFLSGNYICRPLIGFKCEPIYLTYEIPENTNKYEQSKLKFEEYSSVYPNGMTKSTFKALLVAIVEKENWNFDDAKLKELSEEIKSAFKGENEKYFNCKDKGFSEERFFTCILSIYKTGVDVYEKGYVGDKITEGLDYSQDIKESYRKWQYYFCIGGDIEKQIEEEKPKSALQKGIDYVSNLGATIEVSIRHKDRVEIAFNYLKSYKFSDGTYLSNAQISGIIGNLIVESELNPYVEGDYGSSIGIAQWRDPSKGVGRKTELLKSCPQTNTKSKDPKIINNLIKCQLGFLVKELESTEDTAYSYLKRQKTIRDATILFMEKFERCKTELCHEDKRIAYAIQVFNMMN